MGFSEKLAEAVARNRSLLCIGLDPEPAALPAAFGRGPVGILSFNRVIIDATRDLVCGYKPNAAFYERFGAQGWAALRKTIAAVPRHIPVVLDAKRGDVEHTMRAYAEAVFEQLGADAVTVAPWYGHDALQPFFAYRDRGVFLVCRTSNPGAAEFQDAVYLRIAARAVEWNAAHGHVGLVVGATQTREARAIRAVAAELPILLPGVGAQGGDVSAAVAATLRTDGAGVLASASRSVLYAGGGPDFAERARQEAQRLRDAINTVRPTATLASS